MAEAVELDACPVLPTHRLWLSSPPPFPPARTCILGSWWWLMLRQAAWGLVSVHLDVKGLWDAQLYLLMGYGMLCCTFSWLELMGCSVVLSYCGLSFDV